MMAALSSSEVATPKIIVIGLNKTGTTSLGDALCHNLHLRRFGWNTPLNCLQSRYLTLSLYSSPFIEDPSSASLAPLFATTAQYAALEDFPFPLAFASLAKAFPSAKFILSVRKDEETWLRSQAAHTRWPSAPWIGHKLVYGAYRCPSYPSPERELYRGVYREHNASVRKFFADQPDRLLEINIDGGVEWKVLCEFVGIGGYEELLGKEFPRSNVTGKWKIAEFGLGCLVPFLAMLDLGFSWFVALVEMLVVWFFWYEVWVRAGGKEGALTGYTRLEKKYGAV